MDDNDFAPFPHHTLQAYHVALEFIRVINSTRIVDADCRKHARASAKSCARNLAEGSGRRSLADKRRVYGIAHGELIESVACVEISPEAQGGGQTGRRGWMGNHGWPRPGRADYASHTSIAAIVTIAR